MAVGDHDLRVRGLQGLRIPSRMLAVASTETDTPTIMVAEKDAAIMRGAARQEPAA